MIGSQLRAVGLALTLFMTLAACSRPASVAPAAGNAPPPPDPWPQFSARFLEAYFKAEPKFAVEAGRHEFDGQMPDWSAPGIAAQVALLRRLRAEAAALSDAQLSAPERFEREHLYTVIDSELFWLDRARYPFSNPAWYIERLDPDVYLSRDYAPLEKRLKGYIGYARAIPKICADIRANLKTPLPETFIKYGIAGFGGFASFYRHDVAAIFASVKDPVAQAELAAADAAAAQAMDALKQWLEGQRAHATQAFALGEPLFLEMLRVTERVDLPIERLLEIGNADLERNLAALKQACAPVPAEWHPRRLCREDERRQARRRGGGRRARAAGRPARLRPREAHRHLSPGCAGAGGRGAALHARQRRLHQCARALRARCRLRCTTSRRPDPAWSAKEQRRVHPGEGEPALHQRARGLAGSLPAVPALERQSLQDRCAVGRLRLRRRLGALHRGDDVG